MDEVSKSSMEIYRSGQLTAEERLYFSLWRSNLLNSISVVAQKKFIAKGAEISYAFFVVKGQLLAVDGETIYRWGPGSVIGLAQGLKGKRMAFDVVTVTTVQLRVIPLHKIDDIVNKLPKYLRSTFMTMINRTVS